jgi:hypothetical protein
LLNLKDAARFVSETEFQWINVNNDSDTVHEHSMTYVPVGHKGLLTANEKVEVFKEDRIKNLNPITFC